MPAGRPPKPTALKALAGNPGKRALNKSEPKPSAKKPKMPSHLSAEAQREWKRLVRELGHMKLLTSIDADALAMYCETYAQWVKASGELAKTGLIVKTENGFPVQSPYISIANQCMKTMKGLLTEFGMTPASRSRLRAPEEATEDPFDEFLQRRRG